MLDAPTDEPRLATVELPSTLIRPSTADLARLSALLMEGKKITILGGAGCAGAHAELIATAKALKAPIVHALRGKAAFDLAPGSDRVWDPLTHFLLHLQEVRSG